MEKEKYTDEQIDAFLSQLNIKLWPCQREMFKWAVNADIPVYYMPARYNGRTIMLEMLNRFYDEIKEK